MLRSPAASPLARERMARIDTAGGACARCGGPALLKGRELAVAGMAPVSSLQAITTPCGGWRDRKGDHNEADSRQAGKQNLAHERLLG